jgi:Tfp pilus assembly protein PilV
MHRSVSGFEVVMIRWYRARLAGSVIRSVVLVAVLAAAGGSPSLIPAAADDHFGIPQVKYINEQIAAGWEDAGLRPSAAATDGEWCRRLHLDVIGRIPTSEELQGFLANTSPSKRPELVARLLGDEYVDEYARNWTDVWTTVLIGRDVANERVNRPGMRQYLRRAFSKNKPYDRFMEELVTATGATANRKDIDGFNGATNFLSGKLEEMGVENAVQATAKTAQIFLGLQVQCTQCHNHPFNKGKQNQFWEMNAFFRQTRALRRFDGSRDVQWVELVDEDWAGEGGNPEEAELYYELRNGLMKVAYPVFVDGTEISKSGYLPGTMEDGTPYGVHRRRELAKLIKASPYFPKAIVNRVWSHFLGYGFTKPVDDLGEHNPPSHPELLDGLAERFREQSFDFKELVRWIVLSRPYALSSRTVAGNAKDDPALGEKPKFSHFYLRQMQAEQLYESLLTATQADKTQRAEEAAKKKDQWLSQFVIAFGTDEGDDATTFNGSIPQVLMMFNGDLIKQATSTGKGGFLDAVATSGASAKAKIDTLYVAALARKPSAKEVATANAILKARGGDVVGALQDIWWAVLNSNEVIINH